MWGHWEDVSGLGLVPSIGLIWSMWPWGGVNTWSLGCAETELETALNRTSVAWLWILTSEVGL